MWTALTIAIAYVAIFAAYAWWAFERIGAGATAWPFLVGWPVVHFAVPLLVVLASFLVAWLCRAQRPPDVRLSWRGALRLFWNEFRAVAGNAPRMVFYRVLLPEPRPAPSARPILLVHGVLCNAGMWSPFQRWLDQRHVAPVYTLSYGPPLAAIDVFAEQVAVKIDAILAATGAKRVVVVGHSMGGLVMLAYVRKYGGAKIARLITIGTPYAGSMHAWMGFGMSVAQLRPRNAWLCDLRRARVDALPPVVSLWSWHDSMVTPQTSSRIDFGDNVVVAGVGHNALLRDPEIFDLVRNEIDKVPVA